MDELIGTFIRSQFSEELVEEIYKSFGLFGLFNHQDGIDAFDSILGSEESDDTGQMSDLFIATLNEQLDYLLEQHTLRLTDEATIEQKNEILRGLYMIQHLTDYTPLALTLESQVEPEVKVARIIEEVTMYEESQIMSLVESYRDAFLNNLKLFIYQQEEERKTEDNSTLVGQINKNLRTYHRLFGASEFTQLMLESEILPAQDFKDYLPFLSEILVVPDLAETAKRIYWLLLLSGDGTVEPLETFRAHSEALLGNIDKISKVEQIILNLIGQFEELRKAENEKA